MENPKSHFKKENNTSCQSYLFSSYSLINWLEKCNIIGNLKPKFELTISWD